MKNGSIVLLAALVGALRVRAAPPAPEVLFVVDSLRPHANETNFRTILDLYGATSRRLDLRGVRVSAESASDAGVVFLHVDDLATLDGAELEAISGMAAAGAAIYVDALPDRSPSARISIPALATLTRGAVLGVAPFPGSIVRWEVSAALPGFGGPFAGRAVRSIPDSQWDLGVDLAEGAASAERLIVAEDTTGARLPIQVRIPLGRGAIFVDSGYHRRRVGGSADTRLLRDLYAPRYFSALLPSMLFVRFAFGDRVWHSDAAFANLTIDDPSLVSPYGHLDFFALLDRMTGAGFHTTIAIPPVKFAATKPDVAALFRGHPERYSLVVHGNNHDGAECEDRQTPRDWELDFLEGLTRMDALAASTGIPYGRVMVFPCGMPRASVLPLLKKYGFIATVNAQGGPRDTARPADPDFGMHAIETDYAGVPTIRRLPVHAGIDPAALAESAAFDAFLGRPALYYAHEDLFTNGPSTFDDPARAITEYVPGLRFTDLATALLRSYLWRREAEHVVAVQMRGSAILLRNPLAETTDFRISKPEDGTVPVRAVLSDRVPVPFQLQDGELRIERTLRAGQQALLEVVYDPGTVDLRPALVQTAGSRFSDPGLALCNDGDVEGPGILAERPSRGSPARLLPPVFVPAHGCAEVRAKPLPARTSDIELVADPFDEVFETNEGNNSLVPWRAHPAPPVVRPPRDRRSRAH